MDKNKSVVKPEEIHLSLVISGAVSLGSYEAGALVKLIGAVRESQKPDYKGPKLVIDVIAGASAGAMTGAMVAYCLLYGVREEILYEVWVQETDIKKLLNKFSNNSILSSRQIKEFAEKYMKNPKYLPPEYIDKSGIQKNPIRLVISLTNLNGRSFSIPIQYPDHEKEDFKLFTYRDGRYYDLKPGEHGWDTELTELWENIRGAAVASGAFPVAFEPVKLKNRPEPDFDEISSGESFYTDGGVLNNKPLGLAIKATFSPKSLGSPENAEEAEDLSPSDKRYFVLLQPEAGQICPLVSKKKFAPFEVGVNAFFSIPRHQSIYEDIRRIRRINTHIGWNEEFLTALSDKIKVSDNADFQGLETVVKQKCRDILDLKKKIASEHKKDVELYNLEKQIELKQGKTDEPEPELIRYLRLYISLIGRLRGKGKIDVYVIRPTTEPGKEKEILAGEFLIHFGGFLSKKLRKHDFTVGYRNTQEWLGKMGFNDLAGNQVSIYSLRKNREIVLDYDARLGEISFKDLSYMERLFAYFTGIKAIEGLFHNFARKHPEFNKLFNLFIGFLTLLAYLFALVGGGIWVILAFLIFIIGVYHAFDYLQKVVEVIKNFF